MKNIFFEKSNFEKYFNKLLLIWNFTKTFSWLEIPQKNYCILSALMPWNTFARFMSMMNVRTFAIFIRPRLRAKYSYTLCTQSIPINPPPLHQGEIISEVTFLFFMKLCFYKKFLQFKWGSCNLLSKKSSLLLLENVPLIWVFIDLWLSMKSQAVKPLPYITMKC